MSKLIAMVAALTAVSAAMREQNDLGGKWDSQDSKFKNVRAEVDAALALPDDVVVTPDPVVITQEQDDDILALISEMNGKLEGFEDVLGDIQSRLPASDPAPAEETTA